MLPLYYRSLGKFTIGYFRVKFVHGEIFSSLESPTNKNVTFLFIVKTILCIQFLSCHTSDKNVFNIKFFPNYELLTTVVTTGISRSPNRATNAFRPCKLTSLLVCVREGSNAWNTYKQATHMIILHNGKFQ